MPGHAIGEAPHLTNRKEVTDEVHVVAQSISGAMAEHIG